MRCSSITIFAIALLGTPTWASPASPARAKPPAQNFIVVKDGQYGGLTEAGLGALMRGRDALRQRQKSAASELRQMGSLQHASELTRLLKLNMLLFGPGGGSKSGLVTWVERGERESVFKLQLHEMLAQDPLVGGQDFEDAKRGLFRLVMKNSAADRKVVVLDEIDKGNPAVQAATLSLLAERKIFGGSQQHDAKTESIFATTNSTPAELIDQFMKNGLPTTGSPLLNRYQVKGLVENWLSADDRAPLIERRLRTAQLKELARVDPSLLADERFVEPSKVSWGPLRHILHAGFLSAHPLLVPSYNGLIEALHDKTNEAVRKSEENVDPSKGQLPYFPAAEYTTRLVLPILNQVAGSAFIDFLRSPLADDRELEHMVATKGRNPGPIHLGADSLWRMYLLATTVTMGQTRLSLAGGKPEIDFGKTSDRENAFNRRQQGMLQDVVDEQQRFGDAYGEMMTKLNGAVSAGALHGPGAGHEDETLESKLHHVR